MPSAELHTPSMAKIGEATSTTSTRSADTEEVTEAVHKSPRRLELDKKLAARVKEVREALASSSLDAGADEKVLLDLAADELTLHVLLTDAQQQLALRVQLLIESPKNCLMLAKSLREVGMVNSAVSRRLRECFQTASSLRAQRRFLKDVGRKDDD